MPNNKFFSSFPIISYNGKSMRNIIMGTRLIKNVLSQFDAFVPLTIEDGERPDTIAYDYYGSSELYWLVLLSNSIIDPYYDWPLTHTEFISYIKKKYGSIEQAQQLILYWSHSDRDYFMTPETKSNLSVTDKEGWIKPIYAYDFETIKNDEKRSIVLLDKKYLPQVLSELSGVFS